MGTQGHELATRAHRLDGGQQLVARELQHELARRDVFVGTGIDPEQLGVARDGVGHDGFEARAAHKQRLDHVSHQQAVFVALVVVDVATGERGFVQMPREALVGQGQPRERFRVQLDDGCRADTFEQVRYVGHAGAAASITCSRCCG